MKLLAIETATEACSVALYIDGAVSWRYQVAPREHSRLLVPMLDELLAEAQLALGQLDAVAFGRGPGAFTGVRIAASAIQGIAFGAGLPVVPVSSLAAIAQGMQRELGAARVLAAIDARMSEIYWGAFQFGADGALACRGEEGVLAPEHVPLPTESGWCGAGSGWDTYADVLQQRLGARVDVWQADRFPHARDIAVLAAHDFTHGLALAADQALPVYLRDQVVREPR